MKLKFTLFTLLILSLASCQEKFSGASAKEFELSQVKVTKNLTTKEQMNLDKALKVIALYAMEQKWDKAKKYTNKSIDEIALDVVNNKTYGDVVSFAEDFMKKENEEKIKKIKLEIAEIALNRKKADSVITILESFKSGEINIRKGSWSQPEILVKMLNKGNLTGITQYMFDLSIYSISQNKKIDGVGAGGNSEEGISKGEDDFFTYVSRSLSPIIEKSKRLEKLLENPKYPITNLKKYDLRVKVIASKIVLKDGTKYEYPKKSLADYDAEIETLQKQIKGLKSLDGKLDELELQEADSANKIAYNEEFLPLLKKIRSVKNKPKEKVLKITKKLSLTFPYKYEVKKQKSSGMYITSLSDSLSFDNSDKNLIQYQIRDTTYVEYEDKYDKDNGVLNILEKKNVSYNIKETINELKTTKYYKLVAADENGYIYYDHFGRYRLLRYFKIKNTHYLYTMDFKKLKNCVREFDRSKDFIKKMKK